VSPDSALHIAQHAAAHNKVYGVNLAAPFIIEFFRSQLESVLPYADYLFGNEHEFAVYGKQFGVESDDLAVIAQHAAKQPKVNAARPRTVVVTQGSSPTIVVVDGVVTTYPVPSVPSAEIVDTNGAGDSFVGGFYAGLIQGKPIATCVAMGNYLASEVIRRDGCSFPEHPPKFSA